MVPKGATSRRKTWRQLIVLIVAVATWYIMHFQNAQCMALFTYMKTIDLGQHVGKKQPYIEHLGLDFIWP